MPIRSQYRPTLLVAALLALALMPARAHAQYFGRNQVQYEDFDFHILSTEHFNVYYYPSEREVAEDAARMAERWYSRLSDAFQHAFQDKKPIILYANHADFEQTNVPVGSTDQSIGGVTEPIKDRVVIPLAWTYSDDDHVMGHELTHAFQFDIAKSQTGPGLAALNRVPGWMIEGMAEYLSLGRVDANTTMWLRDAVLHDKFPTIDDLLNTGKFFPYRYGEALWAYIGGKYGDRAVPALFGFATQQGLDAAAQRVLGLTLDSLSARWVAETKVEEQKVIADRTNPDSVGYLLAGPNKHKVGRQNLSPALSPDGRLVAFISERGLFAFDLYVANAETGEIVQRLTSSATNPHFDALSFMNSSGSFSPDSRQFATVVLKGGDQKVVILNVDGGGVQRTLKTDDIGAIGDPAWSPDGKAIVFSGNKGGITDLYLYDLGTDELRQLTRGRETELQPQWSPDGTLIAYATDAGEGTDFQRLTYAPIGIDIMDVATGRTRHLNLFPHTKNINPHFAPDGRSVYFVSDPDGVPDVFRFELSTGRVFRVTNIATGVSGITALSPTLGVARDEGRLAFSVFNNQGYDIRGMTPAEAQGELMETVQTVATAPAAAMPPVKSAQEGLVQDYLRDPATGLPVASSFEVKPYRSRLGLDLIGPPSIGVATSSFGTGLAGGVSAYFSDMLGNKQLGVALQANGTVKDIGGLAQYVNLDHRWNWGAVVGHIPYLQIFRGVQLTDQPGVVEVQDLRSRIFVDQAQGLLQYPFSQSRRLELTGGYTRYSYDFEVNRLLVASNGQVIGQQRTSAPSCSADPQEIAQFGFCAPDPLNLFQAAVAYVGDNSVFGFTSPIQGERFRFEVSPTVGTLQYMTGLADFRHYFFSSPVTVAVRGYHYGRYGRDADRDSILGPLFLGYEWLVRGYDYYSFSPSECGAPAQSANSFTGCPVIDQLFGSRIAVANLEVRVPLLGVEQFGLINFPYLPTELSAFVDAGLAWSHDNPARLAWVRDLSQLHCQTPAGGSGGSIQGTCEHAPVVSTGVSARMNVLGFLVLEAYYAYPFQRTEKGWHWGFNLTPGW